MALKEVQSVNERGIFSVVFTGAAVTIVVLGLLLSLVAAVLVCERINEEQKMIAVTVSLLLSTILGVSIAIRLRTDAAVIILFLTVVTIIGFLVGINIVMFEGNLYNFWWRSLVIVLGGVFAWLISITFKGRGRIRRSVKLYK